MAVAGVVKIEGVSSATVADPPPLDVTAVHAEHADYVWASLHRLGVRDADLPDLLQEVFLVVHRRGDSWDGFSPLRSWLFGICLRLVKNYRRKAHRRRERCVAVVPEDGTRQGVRNPEQELTRRDAEQKARELLDELDPDKRAVFVMFEVEGQSCGEIGETLGIPVGTVYSRLHAARNQFARVLDRWKAREATG